MRLFLFEKGQPFFFGGRLVVLQGPQLVFEVALGLGQLPVLDIEQPLDIFGRRHIGS